MDARKLLEIIKQYEDCPVCEKGASFMLKDEVVYIECECGFIKVVDENNNDLI